MCETPRFSSDSAVTTMGFDSAGPALSQTALNLTQHCPERFDSAISLTALDQRCGTRCFQVTQRCPKEALSFDSAF